MAISIVDLHNYQREMDEHMEISKDLTDGLTLPFSPIGNQNQIALPGIVRYLQRAGTRPLYTILVKNLQLDLPYS